VTDKQTDRQTDGRTDVQAIAYSALNAATHTGELVGN